ncbi:uncharacterized protein TNCV_4857591 [Trichonephila clavipes]|nr:uncharacterized protein TNCV_4857591 [Trichonephila clavipes]
MRIFLQLSEFFNLFADILNGVSEMTSPDSKAARLISSFPITAENYPKAVEQLKLKFGREDLLVQIYVRDLLSLVLKNATTGKNAPDLATLYDMLET